MESPLLPPIPLVDARTDPLALADPVAVRALRDAVFGPFKAAVLPALPLADRIARRWLARSASAYLAELDGMARRTGVAGIYAINISYEYGCTTLARRDAAGQRPILRRTLDWPFLGLGRAAVVARRSGPAGEFSDVTWPGAVGTLTAMAPGRFAAAINQAPLFRRTRANMLRPLDYLRNLSRTLLRERGMPPLHLLRHAFETAADFRQALDLLTKIEVARPVLFTLVGCAADEIAVIERRERGATVHLGEGSVANDWRTADESWEPRPCSLADRRLDSAARRAAIEQAAALSDEPFGWVVPPVRNWNTRLATEMNPRAGLIRVLGFEPCNDADASPATSLFDSHGIASRAAATF
jgi:hypothetical protein